jgi:hypothetical protein
MMLVSFLATLLLVAIVVGVIAAVQLGRRLSAPPPAEHVDRLVRESVVVTLKSGGAFDGVLWESGPRGIVLRSATALAVGGGDPIPVDGELFLFVADVAYIQKP